MSEASFSLAAGDVIQTPLSFGALAVQVDNLGGQWVHFPDVSVYVPPWTAGRVLTLPGRTLLASADTTPPAGQANTGAGEAATLRYTDQPLPPASGNPALALSPTAGSEIILPAASQGPAGASGTWNFAITPSGLAVGTVYRVVYLELAIIPQTSAVVAAAGFWYLTYTGITDKIALGALSIAGSGVVTTEGVRALDPPFEFTHVAGGVFTLTVLNSWSTFGVGTVGALVQLRLLPATF